MIKVKNIKFSELKKFNDSNSVVMMATSFPTGFDFSEVDKFLSDELGFSHGKSLVNVYFISDNVLGSEGRHDWLLEFDHDEIPFNPLVRLQFPDLKWTSDFIYIFKEDYYSGVEVMSDETEEEEAA